MSLKINQGSPSCGDLGEHSRVLAARDAAQFLERTLADLLREVDREGPA